MASSARLDELKKKFEENPRRYFAPLANELRKSGDLEQAIALCRTHLPQQPGHISGHIVLAQALFEAGSLDESRDIFHSALGLDPENLIALRYLGDIAKEARDLDTARSWYQRVLEVDPRNEEIEQLVRDLDVPLPPVEEVSADSGAVEASSVAPRATDPSAPSPAEATPATASPADPAEPDARFAPLSIDEVEIDDSFGAPAGDVLPNDAVAGSHAAAPAADVSDIDPFGLDPSGPFDGLLDLPATPSAEELFFTELSGAHAPVEGAEPDVSTAESAWTPPETHAEPAAGEAIEEMPEVDDEAFYLEPPPPEPAASEEQDLDSSAEQESTHAPLEPDTQVTIPGMDAFAAEYSTGSYDAIPEPEPNDAGIEQVASQQTAEWQPTAPAPVPAVDDGLGLEVMEFVPPSRETPAPAAYPQAPDVDPVLGRTLPAPSNEPSQPPAAFVTETMAELYLQQGFRNEALTVYRELLSRNPSDTSLRERIDQIESGSISSIGMASVSEDVVESALKRHSGRPPRSVRSFFASLAGRRAPAPREPEQTAVYSEPAAPNVDELSSQPEASSGAAPLALDPASTEADVPAKSGVAARPARTTPIPSAAETLASFDPFADAAEAAPLSGSALDTAATPNEPFAEFSTGLSTPSRQTPRSMPAQTPVSAFSHSEPKGRPTRAASNELSLDHVFRGTPEAAPAADGGFSFDQFFSDSKPAGDDAAAAAAAPESGRGGGSADAHDIEQFTAWLEGLKKK